MPHGKFQQESSSPRGRSSVGRRAQSCAEIYILGDAPSLCQRTGTYSGHSSCPSPTELPLLKILDAQPAPCSMGHHLPAAGVQRMGLRKHTPGLKATKATYTRSAKVKQLFVASKEKNTLFTLLKFMDLAKSIISESDCPLPQCRALGAVTTHPSRTTAPACDSISFSDVHLSLPPPIHSRPNRHRSGPLISLRLPERPEQKQLHLAKSIQWTGKCWF